MKKEFYGFFGAQSGEECWFDGGDEGMVKVIYKNSRDELYCKYAKITIEEVTEEEVIKYFEDKENKCKFGGRLAACRLMQEKIDAENIEEKYYACSFCGKSTSKESVIIKGGAGNICSKCVEVCQQLIMDDLSPSSQKNFLKVHGRVVKNSDDVHCPHCGEYWVKVERVRCGECRKHFFLEH